MRRLAVLLLAAAACQPEQPTRAPAATAEAHRSEPAPRRVEWKPLWLGARPTTPIWDIHSDPPNAAIWIDGVDTGARTPAMFVAPPQGVYAVRLKLPGYADDTTDVRQEEGVGLSLGRILRPTKAVDHEKATQEAAKRPVDEQARQATRQFLGADLAHVRVVLDRSPHISLTPFTLRIEGDGSGEVTWMGMDGSGKHTLALRVGTDAVRRIHDALVAQGFSTVVGAERQAEPDSVSFRITVFNAAGEKREAEKWAGDPHARFDAVLAEILKATDTLPAAVRNEIRF